MGDLYGTVLDVCLCKLEDQIEFLQVNQEFEYQDAFYRTGDVLDIRSRRNGARCNGLWVRNLSDKQDHEERYLPSFMKGNFTSVQMPLNAYSDRYVDQKTFSNQNQSIELDEENSSRFILNYRPGQKSETSDESNSIKEGSNSTNQLNNRALPPKPGQRTVPPPPKPDRKPPVYQPTSPNQQPVQQSPRAGKKPNGQGYTGQRPVPVPPRESQLLPDQKPPVFQAHPPNQQPVQISPESNKHPKRQRLVPLPPRENHLLLSNGEEDTTRRQFSYDGLPERNERCHDYELMKRQSSYEKRTFEVQQSAYQRQSLVDFNTNQKFGAMSNDIYALNERAFTEQRALNRRPVPVPSAMLTTNGVNFDTNFNRIPSMRIEDKFTSNTPLFTPKKKLNENPHKDSGIKDIEQKVAKAKISESTKSDIVKFLKTIGCYGEIMKKKFRYLEKTCMENQLVEDFKSNEVCGRVIYQYLYKGWRPNLKPPQNWKQKEPPTFSVSELYLYMMSKNSYRLLGSYLKSLCVDGALMCHILKDDIFARQLLPDGSILGEEEILDLRKDFVLSYTL